MLQQGSLCPSLWCDTGTPSLSAPSAFESSGPWANRKQANVCPATGLNLLRWGILPCLWISLNLETVALPTKLVSTHRLGSGEERLAVTEQRVLPLCFVIWKGTTRFDALAPWGTEAAHFVWVYCSYVLPFKIISSFLTHHFQTKLMVFYIVWRWKCIVLIEAAI